MGCCCSTPDRKNRSTARNIDLETGQKVDESRRDQDDASSDTSSNTSGGFTHAPSYDSSDDEMKSEEGNIVTSTLGHLVGPDSTRTSLQLPSERGPAGSFRTPFACVQFYQSDKIILIELPQKAIACIRDVIIQTWPKGIQSEDNTDSRTYTFRLKGRPWQGLPNEVVTANRLTKNIIEALYDLGWVLNVSSGVSPAVNDKDALILRHQDPPPAKCDWMSVRFNQYGKLELIDAPADVVQIIAASLEHLITKHSIISGERVHEFEFKDNLFSMGKKTTGPQELVLTLLPALEKCGFTVSATLRQLDGCRAPDTWHCCRPVGWTPGLPVFHR